jgi:hypothetical protein
MYVMTGHDATLPGDNIKLHRSYFVSKVVDSGGRDQTGSDRLVMEWRIYIFVTVVVHNMNI